MRIDWIVAIVIFLIFAVWAFSYFTLLTQGRIASRSEPAFLAGERIADYMGTELTSIPANFTAGADVQNVTLWAYVSWVGSEMNSTRVVGRQFSNASLPCMISGSKVYWKANLTSGKNTFFIEYADINTSLECDQVIPQSGSNQTTLWAAEKRRMFSSVKNSQVCSLINSFPENVKWDAGITYDFNVLAEAGGSALPCGYAIPRSGREVFAYPLSGSLMEGGSVEMTVRLWQ